MAQPKPAMYYLLKSFGFNPDEIMQAVETARKELPIFAGYVNATAQNIEAKLDYIIMMLGDMNNAAGVGETERQSWRKLQ